MIHQLIFYPSNDRYLIGEIYKFRSKAGDSMTQYIQQLKDDQSTLQGILENRRGDLDENGRIFLNGLGFRSGTVPADH